ARRAGLDSAEQPTGERQDLVAGGARGQQDGDVVRPGPVDGEHLLVQREGVQKGGPAHRPGASQERVDVAVAFSRARRPHQPWPEPFLLEPHATASPTLILGTRASVASSAAGPEEGVKRRGNAWLGGLGGYR